MNQPMLPAPLRREIGRELAWARPVRVSFAWLRHRYGPMWLMLALTCLGFGLRVALLDTFPLREDEAIYGFWARAAATDPFFLHTWPDKPPMFVWLLQGAFALFGPRAASARFVSIFAGVLTIPVVMWGARQLWQSRAAALIAALLLTFNPYAVSFASTAYTDTLLAFLGTAAVVAALADRGVLAGLLLGATVMTKQQGVFYAPLVIALLLAARTEQRSDWAQLGWALLGVAAVILPVLWWDSRRWAVAPSPWALAQQTYAPLTWLPPQQWADRAAAWAQWLWYLGGSWTVWLMLGAALVVATGMAWRRPRLALIVGWGLAFAALHITSSVQVWDRYLLPLAPWLVLVASGPLAWILTPSMSRRRPEWLRGILILLLVIGLAETVLPGVDAAKGRLPIGGDHGDYAGLTAAIAWVEEQCEPPHAAPAQEARCPAVLYHQVLGWHFRFYLYDDLQPQGDQPPRFDLRWFPSAAYLADNAAKTPYPRKYLIMPDWATPRDLPLHLALRGLTLEPRVRAGRFAVMEIVQPARPLCDWCRSSLATPGQPFAPAALPPWNVPAMSARSAPAAP